MRDTIKSHSEFMFKEADPCAKSAYFIVRAKKARFKTNPRYGILVTKRTFKLAVMRNRAKRLLRDWLQYHVGMMSPEFDYVFILRHGILEADRLSGRVAMFKALRHIARKYGQKPREKSRNAG